MRSGALDLKLRGGLSWDLHLRGPFAEDGEGRMPKFAFEATMGSGGGSSVSAGATWTGEKGYVALQGTPYEVSPLLMGQVVASYEEAAKGGKGGAGLVLGGIDFAKWIKAPLNEGPARVGDADTIKISGAADPERVLADLDTLATQVGTLSLPGVGGKVPKLQGEDLEAAADAIESMKITVYTGAADRVLRRLVVTGNHEQTPLSLDLTFTGVGKDQTIAAPADAKPFSELMKKFDVAGIEALPKAPAKQNKVDEYAACIREASGDRAKARKCAELLNG
jgi:hypothetical protein